MATAVTPSVTTPFEPILCLALETGATEWKIAFSSGLGQRPRLRTVPARDLGGCSGRSIERKSDSACPQVLGW
jgi:hypothetical protein